MSVNIVSIDELARKCEEETQKYIRQQAHETRYCFELMQRGLGQELSEAFTQVYRIYEGLALKWVNSHPRYYMTGESADYFVSAAFSRFYFAVKGSEFARFPSVAQVLQYLKLCVQTVIAEYLRKAARIPEIALELAIHSLADDNIETSSEARELWQYILSQLASDTDQLLAELCFLYDLKPAEIADKYAEHWPTARDVSVALQRIRRNLRKDTRLRQWLVV
ncbi:MAG: sigma-70 family RNA polymerase sigma factor [Chloroflexi bacterium]|nr:MAG: sigma-70 family RNA polymerase sigma factor [Chloroflexota bacterium]